MNWSSRFKRKKDTVAVLFDVGNASIGGALISLSDERRPKILFTCRESITIGKELEMARVLPRMTKVLQSVAKTITSTGINTLPGGILPAGSEIYCILAAPWCLSRTKILKAKRPESFTVSVELLESITEIEGSGFDKELRDDQDREELGRSPLVLIEKKIIKTRLNGYEVQDPFEKKVKRIEVSLFLSATTRAVEEAIKKTLDEVFMHREIHYNSFSLIAYSGLRDIFPKKDDFLFIDVSGEITEISLIRHHVLLETVSFPFGKNAVIRRLSRTLKKEPELAHSDLSLYFKKNLTGAHSEKIKKALDIAAQEWIKLFDKTISKLSENDFVPSTIFFTADHPVEKFFSEIIAQRKIGEFSLEGKDFSVTYMDSELLNPYVEIEKGIEEDEFLALETLFLRRVAMLKAPIFHLI